MVLSKMMTTGLLLLGILFNNFLVNAQTKAVPPTLGQPAYPNSGLTRNRSDVMGGVSSTSKASDVGTGERAEGADERQEEQEKSDDSFRRGPYNQEGEYQYFYPNFD